MNAVLLVSFFSPINVGIDPHVDGDLVWCNDPTSEAGWLVFRSATAVSRPMTPPLSDYRYKSNTTFLTLTLAILEGGSYPSRSLRGNAPKNRDMRQIHL
jgi:hypothetical protein